MKALGLSFILLLWSTSLFSQRDKLQQTALWFRYSNNVSLPKEVKLKSELEHRLFIIPMVRTHQLYLRLIAEKHFKKDWFVGGGFALFMNGANDARNESKLLTTEPRPFIDIGYRQKINDKLLINHRYRTEWRFFKNTNQAYTELEDGFRDNFRFRYQLMLEYMPFKKEEKELRLRTFNEIMINAGKNVGRNIFDQNRTSLGIQFNINKFIGIETSYIFWIQQQASGDSFISRHIVRFGLVSNFSIQKKEKKK